MNRLLIVPILLFITIAGACSSDDESAQQNTEPGFVQFFEALKAECGNAYMGGLMIQPDDVDMFTGTEEMVMHFRECSDSELKIPFHIEDEETGEWNRSRTWIFTLHDDGLELRHDHRNPDGTDEEVTMYGGYSFGAGSERIQRIQSDQAADDSEFRGWRIEYLPGDRYTYGTARGTEWSIMVQFDLTEKIETPPAPWGHE